MNPTATFSIVIVTYNSAATIGSCLASVLATLRPVDSVVVVDNASRDNTTAIIGLLAQAVPHLTVKLIVNDRNRGFSIATNQGVMATASSYVVLLNPDTIVPPLWLQQLATHFTAPDIGALGPVSNYANGRQSVACHWPGELPAGIGVVEAAGLLYEANCGVAEETPLLIGFCLMLRRDLVDRLGCLDERLFLGNDDLELSWRLRLYGYRLHIATDVFIYHEGQHSFHTEPESKTGKLVQESSDALYDILETSYGVGRVPSPHAMWGIDWFAPSTPVYNEQVGCGQILHLPYAYVTAGETAEPLLSIVILTYNQRTFTEECLAAITRHTPEAHEVIIVDNASTDGTPDWLKTLAALHNNYRLILNLENRGFAAGCNQGLAVARGSYLVLLNNDVVVTAEWSSGLRETLLSEPGCGIVGPLTNNASGIQALGEAPYASLADLDLFAELLRKRYRYRRVPSRRLVGFCMLFSRRLYEEIGGLDEQFGTGNFEDDDFCLRAAIAGYQNYVAGDVYVHHHGSVSFKAAGIDYRQSIARNGALFQEKWSRPVGDPLLAQQIAACRIREEAELLLQLEQTDAALALLTNACREFPADRQLAGLRGRAYIAAGSYTKACECFGAYATLALICAAYDLLRQGDGSGAENMMQTAPPQTAHHGVMCQLRGALAISRGEYDYAAELLLTGFKLSPTCSLNPGLTTWLLNAGYAERLFAEARQAAQLYPHSRFVARLMVECQQVRSLLPQTVTLAEQFVCNFGVDEHVMAHGLEARRACGLWRAPADVGQIVSLCMIVKDEEQDIAKCLASCRPLVNEIIIVDTGSTDQTVAIAELFGARVVHRPWHDDFSEARNVSLATASGDWILVMDADEVLSEQDYGVFRQMLREHAGQESAFTLETRNYTNNTSLENWRLNDNRYPEQAGTGWTPSSKLRIWKNRPSVRFVNAVHELVEESARLSGLCFYDCPVPVHHYGGLHRKSSVAKEELYLRLGLKKLEQSGWTDKKALYELAVQAGGMGHFCEAATLYRKVIELDPAHYLAWFNLGYVLLRDGDFAMARQASHQARVLMPELHEATINLAITELCSGNLSEAQAAIHDVLHTQSASIPGQLLQAICYIYAGQEQLGRDICARLRRTNISFSEFINSMVELLDKAGNKGLARQLLALNTLEGYENRES
jgi:GT2 family glycosyltransferase/Flp pilus assembly protein TadD